MTIELHRVLVGHAVELAAPLVAAAESREAAATLIEGLGWTGLPASDLQAVAAAAKEGVEAVEGPDDVFALAAALRTLERSLGRLSALADRWPPEAASLFVSDLLGALFAHHLAERLPRVRAVLELAGAFADAPAGARAYGAIVREARERPRLDATALRRTVLEPAALLRERFDAPGGADAIAELAGPVAARALQAAGLVSWFGVPGRESDPRLTRQEREAARRLLGATLLHGDGGQIAAMLGLTEREGALACVIVPYGEPSFAREPPGWKLAASIDGELAPLVASAKGVDFPAGHRGSLALVATAVSTGPEPLLRLGSERGTRLEVGGVIAELRLEARPSRFTTIATATLERASLVLAGGDGDGFLSSVLPSEPIVIALPVALDWSPRRGLTVRGAAGLDVVLPVRLALGPVEIVAVAVGLRAGPDRTDVELSAQLSVALGPVQASIDRLGLTARVQDAAGAFGPLDLSVGFKAPSGVGLRVDAGPLAGGGYLFHDELKGEYAGVLELECQGLQLKAIGLLTTRLPGGERGFSLLLIITAEGFEPIQLGLGFTLNGIGGLLGVHRTVAVDALRAGLRGKTLDSVLFPADPIRNAARIVSDVRAVFPVAADRYIFGPLAIIGWGTPTLVTLELALILELPAPVRMILLGELCAVLPDAEQALVRLQMSALGVVDFGRGEAALDACLHDSQIAGFPLTGDMAMRASWGARSDFALAVGGFHPHFQPPAGFPALRRVALSLSRGDNPRLRLEAYIALTSNSVQLGARAELRAAAGGFSVEGHLAFDALIQLSPFGFAVDISAGVAVKRGSKTLMSLDVDVSLSGPSPWRIRGRARFKVLFVKVSIPIEAEFGATRQLPPPPVVNVRELLVRALKEAGNWSAQLPPGRRQLVTLAADPAGSVLVHPLGAVTVHQRIVPLGRTITRFGTALPSGERHFDLVLAAPGIAGTVTVPVEDLFAPGQFLELSDAQKLSSPGFERMIAGQRIEVSGDRLPSAPAVTADVEYATLTLNLADGTSTPANPFPVAPEVAERLAEVGAAGLARERYRRDGPSLTVEEPRYVIARADTLRRVAVSEVDFEGTTYTHAHEALRAHLEDHPGQPLQVVARHEAVAA